MNWIHKIMGGILILPICLAGCEPATETGIEGFPPSEPTFHAITPASQIPIPSETQLTSSTTQNNLSGNHFVDGSIDFQNASIINIPIDGTPHWVVSAPLGEGLVTAVVMEDGSSQAFKITDQIFEPTLIYPSNLPAGMPPLLVVTDGSPQFIPPPVDASTLTNPLILDDRLVYVAMNGDLVISDRTSQLRISIEALPDGRILTDERNRLLLLTQPTNRYDHGILGDELEASSITLLETKPEIRIIRTISIEGPDVIEGIAPIWADMDNDGALEIIVTLSNNQTGSRIAAFREDGTLLAESPPIGLGHRWRHQLAVAKFEADKPPLLVSVRTPHIGGIVEFFEISDGRLISVSDIQGFSTHSIGSRNLDSAIAGDLNKDGVIELLAPDQSHTNLGIISIEGVIASLPLDGVLTSNLSAASVNGRLFISAGTQGNLRIWIP